MLGFFRGFLQLATLVHLLEKVVREVMPFLLLMSIVMLGFSFGIHILFIQQPEEGFTSLGASMHSMLDLGVYAIEVEAQSKTMGRWQVECVA